MNTNVLQWNTGYPNVKAHKRALNDLVYTVAMRASTMATLLVVMVTRVKPYYIRGCVHIQSWTILLHLYLPHSKAPIRVDSWNFAFVSSQQHSWITFHQLVVLITEYYCMPRQDLFVKVDLLYKKLNNMISWSHWLLQWITQTFLFTQQTVNSKLICMDTGLTDAQFSH